MSQPVQTHFSHSTCNATQQRGFTLIEVLVAIFLMAILGVIAWRGLDHMTRARDNINQQSNEVSNMVRVLAQLERDMSERAPDIVFPAEARGDTGPSTLPKAIDLVGNGQNLQLTIVRANTAPGGQTTWQSVQYWVDQDGLHRATSAPSTSYPPPKVITRSTDTNKDATTNSLVLLPQAKSISARVWGGTASQWQPWPLPESASEDERGPRSGNPGPAGGPPGAPVGMSGGVPGRDGSTGAMNPASGANPTLPGGAGSNPVAVSGTLSGASGNPGGAASAASAVGGLNASRNSLNGVEITIELQDGQRYTRSFAL